MHFYFPSVRKATQCLALLNDSKPVQQSYAARRDGGPEHIYDERELIGRLQVEVVDEKSIRPAKEGK